MVALARRVGLVAVGWGALVGSIVDTARAEYPTHELKLEKKDEPVRGPAEDLVVEAGFGYGVSALTAIQGHDPKVAHGPMVHAGLGWAWTVRASHSLGVEAFLDGMIDNDKTTGSGNAFGRRLGLQAFVIGTKAHVRVGAGLAHATFDKNDYDGIGVALAAGFHLGVVDTKTWKRPMVTFDIVPSWDFLSAGSETLHRPTFAFVLGVAAY